MPAELPPETLSSVVLLGYAIIAATGFFFGRLFGVAEGRAQAFEEIAEECRGVRRGSAFHDALRRAGQK